MDGTWNSNDWTSIPSSMLYSERVLKGVCFSDWNENILSSTLQPFLFWMLWTEFLQLIFSHIYSIIYLCLSIGYLLNMSICFMISFSLANICFVFEDCGSISQFLVFVLISSWRSVHLALKLVPFWCLLLCLVNVCRGSWLSLYLGREALLRTNSLWYLVEVMAPWVDLETVWYLNVLWKCEISGAACWNFARGSKDLNARRLELDAPCCYSLNLFGTNSLWMYKKGVG